ncbi:MAG: maltotransferase domain-containing protein, partial [Pelovirga sp.]
MVDGRQRVIIENLSPQVEAGKFPAKRTLGELLIVSADIFVDGHDVLSAVVQHRLDKSSEYQETCMIHQANDRWTASIKISEPRDIFFTVAAWVNHFATWVVQVKKKFAAKQDIAVELVDGANLIRSAAERATTRGQSEDADFLDQFATNLTAAAVNKAIALIDDPLLADLMNKHAARELRSVFPEEFRVSVEPRLAAFSAWYELFPRSTGAAGRHGTFQDVIRQLPRISSMGFDILYLPPIHPIGETFRKGRNNTPNAQPDDVGSPWAIGSAGGGHTSIHPELG